MEWIASIKATIDYIENNLLTVKGIEEIAKYAAVSPFYLQTGFRIMTGYSIGEYIRNRKLYLAGLDVWADKEKIIDIEYRYGYDTPESFTKAFSRFHGVSPSQIKKDPKKLKVFLPLKISVTVKGGYDMDYIVEKMSGFKVIGLRENSDMTLKIPMQKFQNSGTRFRISTSRSFGRASINQAATLKRLF